LRGQWRKPCEFESRPEHHLFGRISAPGIPTGPVQRAPRWYNGALV